MNKNDVRRFFAGLVGAVLPEDVKETPEEFGLLNPGVVDAVLEPMGTNLNAAATATNKLGRAQVNEGNENVRIGQRYIDLGTGQIEDGTEAMDNAARVRKATGRKR